MNCKLKLILSSTSEMTLSSRLTHTCSMLSENSIDFSLNVFRVQLFAVPYARQTDRQGECLSDFSPAKWVKIESCGILWTCVAFRFAMLIVLHTIICHQYRWIVTETFVWKMLYTFGLLLFQLFVLFAVSNSMPFEPTKQNVQFNFLFSLSSSSYSNPPTVLGRHEGVFQKKQKKKTYRTALLLAQIWLHVLRLKSPSKWMNIFHKMKHLKMCS